MEGWTGSRVYKLTPEKPKSEAPSNETVTAEPEPVDEVAIEI